MERQILVGRNILTGISEPPPEVNPNILAGKIRNERFHLIPTEISGIVGLMECTQRYPNILNAKLP